MTDVHSKETRSFNMSRIRSKDTKPEITVRKFLFANGLRYRLHSKQLPGKPDLVLPKHKTVIFIHGCFWHGHENCKHYSVPKTRTDWWLSKIANNATNHNKSVEKLEATGWKVVIVWECGLKKNKRGDTLSNLLALFKPQINIK